MIVFPMAGMSRRFTEAGYDRPKYMLEAHGRTLFGHAVGGFHRLFASEPFLFILRDVQGTAEFVRAEVERLGIADARIAVLEAPTSGQAETVALGLRQAGVPAEASCTIFNIDTFRWDFAHPPGLDLATVDGYLEVFRGEGANWSYVKPVPGTDRVAETTEKVPVSDLCCTGLYHFRTAGLFLGAYGAFAGGEAAAMGLKELYVAPMYNRLIAQGREIRLARVDPRHVTFGGVPAEYDAFLAGPAPA